MRTVTFSDRAVADLVKRSFVPAWHNRGPGFHNEEFSTEKWISGLAAYPTKNIATFFLRPDGGVYFYVAGYYSPKLFLEILQFAQKPDKHEERARAMEASAAKMKEWNLAAAYRHIADVLRDFADRKDLPTLAQLQFQYKYGNEFTEEPTGGGRLAVRTGVFADPEEPDPLPPPKETKLSPFREKYETVRRAFDDLNTRLWDKGLDRKERQSIQNQMMKLADELALWQARMATLEGK
jgi:hypothetical protein